MSNDEERGLMIKDTLILCQALYSVVLDSEEVEIVRIALSALTNTEVGQSYLRAHPVTL